MQRVVAATARSVVELVTPAGPAKKVWIVFEREYRCSIPSATDGVYGFR